MKINLKSTLQIDITDNIIAHKWSNDEINKRYTELENKINTMNKQYGIIMKIESYGHVGEFINIEFYENGFLKDELVKALNRIYIYT